MVKYTFLLILLVLFPLLCYSQSETYDARIDGISTSGNMEFGSILNTEIRVRNLSTSVGTFTVRYRVFRKITSSTNVEIAAGEDKLFDINVNETKSIDFSWEPDLAERPYFYNCLSL
jgi:hypothetical protein